MTDEGYLATAARTVFGDKTWWWKSLILAVLNIVPLVGAILVGGYHMVLMRETAWGGRSGLSDLSDLREIGRRGVDGFVVSFVWVLPVAFVIVLPVMVYIMASAGEGLPWWWIYVVAGPVMLFSAIINVALLRAAIYVRAAGGLSVSGVIGLIKRCPAGFRTVTLIALGVLLVGQLLGAPASFLSSTTELPPLVNLALSSGWSFVVGLILAPLTLVVRVAYGLWARDTDLATWEPI